MSAPGRPARSTSQRPNVAMAEGIGQLGPHAEAENGRGHVTARMHINIMTRSSLRCRSGAAPKRSRATAPVFTGSSRVESCDQFIGLHRPAFSLARSSPSDLMARCTVIRRRTRGLSSAGPAPRIAIAGHRGDQGRAALRRRVAIELADPGRQMWQQPRIRSSTIAPLQAMPKTWSFIATRHCLRRRRNAATAKPRGPAERVRRERLAQGVSRLSGGGPRASRSRGRSPRQPGNPRMQMHSLCRVDVIEGEAGGAERLELSADFRRQAASRIPH